MSDPDRDAWLARVIADTLPAGLAPEPRRAALGALLDTVERVHHDSGAPHPPWLRLARELHGVP